MNYLLNESREEPAKELDYRNDTDRKLGKQRYRRTAAINADLLRRLNEDNQKNKRDFDIASKAKVSTHCF